MCMGRERERYLTDERFFGSIHLLGVAEALAGARVLTIFEVLEAIGCLDMAAFLKVLPADSPANCCFR